MIGILFMLYGPTASGNSRSRAVAPVASFAQPPPTIATAMDFAIEEPVREVHVAAPLPPIAPAAPPPIPVRTAPPPSPPPPRLGVSAPLRGRHLAPPPRSTVPPPMPRSRSARGSEAPPVRTADAFATENQRTVRRDDFDPDTTFVD